MVQDIDRPDVNGVPPKMLAVCQMTQEALDGLAPVLMITTDDNLTSFVEVRGSFDTRDTWSMNILHNSRYFIIFIKPPDGERYYNPLSGDDRVSVELIGSGRGVTRLRKYTGPLPRVLAKLRAWLAAQQAPAK